jgi:hypothetical protein
MRIRRPLNIFVCVAGLIGCGRFALTDVVEDPELAKQTLVAALDAWKAGQVRSLGSQVPPIRFADDDQRAGSQLVEYDFSEPDQPIRPFHDVKIAITLRNARGMLTSKLVCYQVGVDPDLTVLRSDN